MGIIGAPIGGVSSGYVGTATVRAPLIVERTNDGVRIAIGDSNNVIAQSIYRPTGGVLGQLSPYIQALTVAGASLLVPGSAAALLGTAESTYRRSQRGDALALNLGGILQSTGSILGGFDNQYLSGLGQVSGFASNFFGPSPQVTQIAGPVFQPQSFPSFPSTPQATPVGLPVAVAAGAVAARVAPLLVKIAIKLGLRAKPTLTRAVEIVRKAGKLLQSPEAVAVALGLTTAELATLIVSSQHRRRRRMNPANSRALRRAARRIKSFHRMCKHVDVIQGRFKKKSRGSC